MESRYKIKYLEQATKFLDSLSTDVYDKIMYNIDRVLNGSRDKVVFKKLKGHDIWEIRTKYRGQAYRLFTFFDKYTGDLIVATSGIVKKTEKIPQNIIKTAEKIMKDYYIKHYPNKK